MKYLKIALFLVVVCLGTASFAFDYYKGVPVGLGVCRFAGYTHPCVIVEAGEAVNIILQDDNNHEISVYQVKVWKENLSLEEMQLVWMRRGT